MRRTFDGDRIAELRRLLTVADRRARQQCASSAASFQLQSLRRINKLPW